MNYKKIIIYLIIIALPGGYWFWTTTKQADKSITYKKFAEVYAGTAVMAELFRNKPDQFFQARDSIYLLHNFNADSIELLRQSLTGREEEWSIIWGRIEAKTDSLTKYFRANPIIDTIQDSLPADSIISTDSTVAPDTIITM